MYLQHFQLREYPFRLTPDTDFFFQSTAAQEALNTILVSLDLGEGFIKVTGEVGTGKSLLCRMVIDSLDDSYRVALVLNPYRNPQSLFLELCDELGADYPARQRENQHVVWQALTRRIMELNEDGERVVIILDEAQAMPAVTLEALRLLTNLETQKRKLVQIVLFGQPELDRVLDHPSVRQLRQRITFHHDLQALAGSQLAQYLAHRLQAAGHADGRLFTPWAVRALRSASRGVPRRVNVLAHKALLSAFGRGRRRVGWSDVRAAARDTPEESPLASPWRWRGLTTGLLGLLLLAVALLVLVQTGQIDMEYWLA